MIIHYAVCMHIFRYFVPKWFDSFISINSGVILKEYTFYADLILKHLQFKYYNIIY